MRELRPNRWLPRLRKSNRKPRDVAVSALGGLASPTPKSTDSTLHDKAAGYVKPTQRINSDRLTLTITNDSIPQQPHQLSNNRFHRVFKLRDVKKVLRNKRASAPPDQFRNPSPPSPPPTNPANTIELRPPPPPPPHKIRFNRRHRSAMPANIIDPPSPPTLRTRETVDQFFDDAREENPKFFCAVEEKKLASNEMLDDDDDDNFYQVPCPAPSRRVADVSLENLPKHHSRPTRAPPNSIRFSRRNRAPLLTANSDQPYVNRFYSEGHRDVDSRHSISLSFTGLLDRSRPSSTSRRKMLESPKSGDGAESRTWQLSAGELRFNSLNVKHGKRKRDNPMRPLTVSDASSAQANLRASLSAPQVSAMKESGGNSFWFAERPKPRSRLLSAFQFRLGSRLESRDEPPPPIASALEIPWTAPGGVDDDDLASDSDDSQARDISNSFLSFPFFNMLARGPAVGNTHSSRTSPPKSPASSSVAMRLLRRPFTGRSFPVPAAARAKAKAAEQALEEFVAEKAMRPSDASTSLPTPGELELEHANSPDDPHEFDVDEYSSLHSAIAAMLSEHALSRGRSDFMELSDSKVRLRRLSDDIRKPVETTRFQSTGAPVSSEIANGCAFSGTVLSFTMDPSKSSIQVPPAPLVYGPESTAWRNVLSEFSDPQTSNPELQPDEPKNEELSTVFESEPYGQDNADEVLSYKRVPSSFERMGSFDFDKPAWRDGDLILGETNPAERGMKHMTKAEVSMITGHPSANVDDVRDVSAPQQVPPLIDRYDESLQPRVRDEYEEKQRSVLLDHTSIPPTLADVQKLAAETRRISARRERHNGLLEMWQHRVLADLSRASDGSPMRFAGVRSEATTFTTFSETSKEFDRASMASSDDLYVAAPSTVRTNVIGSAHSELIAAPEIVDSREPDPHDAGPARGAHVEQEPELLEFGPEVR